MGRQTEGRSELAAVLDASCGGPSLVRARVLQALSLALRPAGCIEGLTAALPSGAARLYPESKTSFAVRTQDARVDFQHDSKGRVTGAAVLQEGQTTKARKIV